MDGGGKAAARSKKARSRHRGERDAPMMIIVWISAERDEWTLFMLSVYKNRTPARGCSQSDS
jgi:hypothetical protein